MIWTALWLMVACIAGEAHASLLLNNNTIHVSNVSEISSSLFEEKDTPAMENKTLQSNAIEPDGGNNTTGLNKNETLTEEQGRPFSNDTETSIVEQEFNSTDLELGSNQTNSSFAGEGPCVNQLRFSGNITESCLQMNSTSPGTNPTLVSPSNETSTVLPNVTTGEPDGTDNLVPSEGPLGRCRDPVKCMENCFGDFSGAIPWSCMKLEYCLLERLETGVCDWVLLSFCRRRRQLTQSTLEGLSASTVENVQRRVTKSINWDLCYEDVERCPGACNPLGTCVMFDPFEGACSNNEGMIMGEDTYYISCQGCSLSDCKRNCYKDLGCQGVEYISDGQICKVFRAKPTDSLPTPGVNCYPKDDFDYASCTGTVPILLNKGYCRNTQNKQGRYIVYKNLQGNRDWLRSHCKLLCEMTPGCTGFEIYSSHCETHFDNLSKRYTVPSKSSKKPECYRLKQV